MVERGRRERTSDCTRCCRRFNVQADLGVHQGNVTTRSCLHLGQAFGNGVPVLLAAQSLHGLAMRVVVHEDVRALCLWIDNFQFTLRLACNAADSSLFNLAIMLSSYSAIREE